MSSPIVKPYLRGHFHQAAFFVAIGACIMLIVQSNGFLSTIASSIYSACLITLLGVSALYHRINWNPRKRMIMRRLDHAAIYLLIAGTATPVGMLAMNAQSGRNMLIMTWVVAFLGLLQSIFFVKAPKWLSAILYMIAGYLIIPYLSEIHRGLGVKNLTFILVGGFAYTLGALTYAFKWPRFNPKYFGYHEVFHILVIIGAVFHFVVISSIAAVM